MAARKKRYSPGAAIDVWDESIELWIRVCAWIETLVIREGELAGQRFELQLWQIDFIRAICDKDYQHLNLSIARGNGKTTLLGAIIACALAGPLAVKNTEIPVVAAEKQQASIAVRHAYDFLEPWFLAEGKAVWIYKDNKDAGFQIINKRDRITAVAVSADPRSKHGKSFSLAIEDEPAQWSPISGERVHNAMMGSRGKQEHSRVVSIGTRPDSPSHWFSKALKVGRTHEGRTAGTWSQLYCAKKTARYDDIKEIKKANPMWDHIPSLRKTILKELEGVKMGKDSKSSFMAYRMNMGVMETSDIEYILFENTVNTWLKCVVDEVNLEVKHPRQGKLYIGIDIGDADSLTAVVFYWPATQRMEIYAAIGDLEISLEDRQNEDGNAGIYTAAEEMGELKTFPANATPVADFIDWMVELLDGYVPTKIYADNYKKADLTQKIKSLGKGWKKKIDTHRVGQGPEGNQDITNFRKAVLEGGVKCKESVLMLAAMKDAKVERSKTGYAVLDKSRKRGRIDVLQAAVLAVGAGYYEHQEKKAEQTPVWDFDDADAKSAENESDAAGESDIPDDYF